MATAATELETKSLPANAYQPLKDGELYVPLVPPSMSLAGSHLARGALGHAAVHHLQRGFRLLRPEGRPGNGGGDSHLHPRHRAGAHVPPPLHRAGERHPDRHWRGIRQRGRRRRLHHSGALHPPPRSASVADRLHLPGRRLPRRSLPHSAAPLFRARAARQAALSRSHGHHRGAGHRRKGRLPGQAVDPGHRASPRSTISSSPPSMSGRST